MRGPRQKVIKTLMHYRSVHLKCSWQVKVLPGSTLTVFLVWLCKRNVAVEKFDCDLVLAHMGPKFVQPHSEIAQSSHPASRKYSKVSI